MKAKRLTALLLLVVTLIGMLPGTTLAANTPEEALGEIQIFCQCPSGVIFLFKKAESRLAQ